LDDTFCHAKYSPGRIMRADRLLSIVMLLQTRGKMTARALSQELEVSQRTILRDIDALSTAGVPVYAEGGHGGGIALDENYRTTLTGLKESEIRSLFISGNAKLLRDIGLGEAAESSLLKLSAALPLAHQPSVEHIRQRILIDPLWWWHESQPRPFWSELQQAVYEDRRVRAIYENYNGEIVERVLEPYSLVAKASLWYLVAKRDGELRTYRISRFHDVVLLDMHFQREENFDLAKYWQDHAQEFVAAASDYGFTLRLHSSRLNLVRGLTPGRHRIIDAPDDDEWVTVQLQMESPELAKILSVGLGKQAMVVEPPELRAAVLNTAREIMESYG
jgi:predicted DNA-binding transcriptional regulator YafY